MPSEAKETFSRRWPREALLPFGGPAHPFPPGSEGSTPSPIASAWIPSAPVPSPFVCGGNLLGGSRAGGGKGTFLRLPLSQGARPMGSAAPKAPFPRLCSSPRPVASAALWPCPPCPFPPLARQLWTAQDDTCCVNGKPCLWIGGPGSPLVSPPPLFSPIICFFF